MTLTWPLKKFSTCQEDGTWDDVTQANGNIILQVQGTHMVVIQNSVQQGSFSLSTGLGDKTRVTSKGFIMVIVLQKGCTRHKLRIKFTTQENCVECCEHLESFVQVLRDAMPVRARYEPIEELIKTILQGQIQASEDPPNRVFPEGFNIQAAFGSYIMHPSFPDMVQRVETVLKKLGQL